MNRCGDCGGPLDADEGGHVPVPLTSEYGVHVHVDEAIAPLVERCWALGITTTSSCQGGEDEPAFLGLGPGSAEAFARTITLAVTPEEFEAQPDEALDWRIYLWDWAPGYPWQGGFSVRFPPSDIPELVRRLGRFR